MKTLLIPIGSHGDVHPFVGLGVELARRGHAVTVLTNPHFQKLVEKAGLGFLPLATAEEYQEVMAHPDLWHATRGVKFLFSRLVTHPLRPVYQAIADFYEPGRTLVVNTPIGLGARLAQEKLGVPLVTAHVAPSSIRSATLPPVLPGPNVTPAWSALWFRRLMYWVADRAIVDPLIVGELNRFRGELGLPPVSRVINGWWNSPQLAVGMFPDWFGPPQPDWPPQLRLTGFPRYDEATLTGLPEGVDEFLNAGEPPVVFTPGSANQQARAFFRAALQACQELGRRGLFLTGYEEHLPADLPATVRWFRYVPFSQVFPRCAAVAHHGGIGTTAQCLAAGVPQLVMPLSFDQPDNAARVQRLGCGEPLYPNRFTGPNVARALQRLLTDPVRRRCREVATRFDGEDAIGATCDLLERFAARGEKQPVA